MVRLPLEPTTNNKQTSETNPLLSFPLAVTQQRYRSVFLSLSSLLPSLLTPLSLSPTPHANQIEAKEAFSLFDKRGAGSIPSESLGDVLRALGQNPTQKEVKELAAAAGGGGRDSEFRSLVVLVAKWSLGWVW